MQTVFVWGEVEPGGGGGGALPLRSIIFTNDQTISLWSITILETTI